MQQLGLAAAATQQGTPDVFTSITQGLALGTKMRQEQEDNDLANAKLYYQQEQDRITNDLNARKFVDTQANTSLAKDKFEFEKRTKAKADEAVNAAHSFMAELAPSYSSGRTVEERLANAGLKFTELTKDPRFKDVPVPVLTGIKEVFEKSPTFSPPKVKELIEKHNDKGEIEIYTLDEFGRTKPLMIKGLDPNVAKLMQDARQKYMDAVKESMQVVTAAGDIYSKAKGGVIQLGSAISSGDAAAMTKEIFKLVPEMENQARLHLKQTIGADNFPDYLDKLLSGSVKDKAARSELVKQTTGIDPALARTPSVTTEQFVKTFNSLFAEMRAQGRPIDPGAFQALEQEAKRTYLYDTHSYANALHALEQIAPDYAVAVPSSDYAALALANKTLKRNITDFEAFKVMPVNPSNPYEADLIETDRRDNAYRERRTALQAGDPYVAGWPETGSIPLSRAREVVRRVAREEKTIKEVWTDMQDEVVSQQKRERNQMAVEEFKRMGILEAQGEELRLGKMFQDLMGLGGGAEKTNRVEPKK